MAIIKWEYGTWNSVLGYCCNQCHTYCIFDGGALRHEEAIEENGGICPNIKEKVDNER